MSTKLWDPAWNNTSAASYIYREYILHHTREYPKNLHPHIKRDLDNYHVIGTLPNGPYKSMLEAFGRAGGFAVLDSVTPFPLVSSAQAQQNGIYIQGMATALPSNVILAANNLSMEDSDSILANVSQTSYKAKDLDDNIVVAPEGKNIDYGSTGRARFEEVGAMFIVTMVSLVVVLIVMVACSVALELEQNEQAAGPGKGSGGTIQAYEEAVLSANM